MYPFSFHFFLIVTYDQLAKNFTFPDEFFNTTWFSSVYEIIRNGGNPSEMILAVKPADFVSTANVTVEIISDLIEATNSTLG